MNKYYVFIGFPWVMRACADGR